MEPVCNSDCLECNIEGKWRADYCEGCEKRRRCRYDTRLPKGKRLPDIDQAAAKEGLSYGHYVQKHGL